MDVSNQLAGLCAELDTVKKEWDTNALELSRRDAELKLKNAVRLDLKAQYENVRAIC